MDTANGLSNPSRSVIWLGRILSGLAVLFLLFDSIIHLMAIPPVTDALAKLGYPAQISAVLGVLEIASLILYLIPATQFSGAILLTGYLGGAVSAQIRIEAPLFSTALFPVYVGILIWGGLYLRDAQVRTVVPCRRTLARQHATDVQG